MKGQASIFTLVFVVIILGVLGLFVILNYNGLVKAEKGVEEAQAQIATVCQRRLDLIPNLIETVKAYAAHERQTLEAVTLARNQAVETMGRLGKEQDLTKEQMTELATTQTALTSAVRGIFALVENYPNLRAASNFMALQDQFEGTENRIAVARQRYNSAARYYNSKIETFPGVFLAPMFGFGSKDYYEAKENAYEGIKASF
jgi:LemA protein